MTLGANDLSQTRPGIPERPTGLPRDRSWGWFNVFVWTWPLLVVAAGAALSAGVALLQGGY